MKRVCANLAMGLCVSLSFFWLAGCGGKRLDTVPVEGTVMVDGKPMEGVSVIFSPSGAGGRAASGGTDASGAFKLTTQDPGDGALEGSYQVSFTKITVEDDGLPKEVDPNDPASMDAIYGQMDPRKKAKSKAEIDQKFTSPSTSGITADVKKGAENKFSFEIKGS